MKDAVVTYFSVIFSLMIFSAYAGYHSREHVSPPQAEFSLSGLELDKADPRTPQAEYIDVLPPVESLKLK